MEPNEFTYYEHPDITRALFLGGRYPDEIEEPNVIPGPARNLIKREGV
jgi:hypothetical protein